jgi:PRTRC genetic system protein A
MVELDDRDRILQRHTPALMVPRFGELPPIEKSGHRYLVAEDGLWLEVKRPWLHARVPLRTENGAYTEGVTDRHRLPFGRPEKLVRYLITEEDLDDLRVRFLADAHRALPNEYAAWGVYDDLTGNIYYSPCIALEAGARGIQFHRPTLGLNEHFAIDIHSHATMDAFFSPTDDEDDAGEVKLSIVAGSLDREPTWAVRLCLLGMFFTNDAAAEEPEEAPV